MDLEIKYELSDWKEFQKFIEKRACKESWAWWDSMWFSFLLWFAVSFLLFSFFQSDAGFSWPTALIVGLLSLYFVALLVLNGIKVRRACLPAEGGSFLDCHKFAIDDDGIRSIGSGYEARHKWSSVHRVENTEKAIYVFIDSVSAFIFPRSKVKNPEELLAVINRNVTNKGR